ncbi:MAG TPA: 2-C-methyl-D-erythritol 4-phosphate cytidylyltransferase [Nocardioidaceae bacterium]|nr:2-C-methyl-D-erythritol 4-phosphate cytidylyltransferase [Nocardioidaceae bacterium]
MTAKPPGRAPSRGLRGLMGPVNPHESSDDRARAMGQVPTTGRGSMPYALLDGEPLVALASFALEDAGVELVEFHVDLTRLRDRDRPLVVHDPLCPLTPPGFIREAVDLAVAEDAVVVGVHPVTDTIKRVDHGVVGDTVDREGLWTVTSPVVLPASVVTRLDGWPDADDVASLVARLRETAVVRFLEAPPLGRRVDDESSLVLLGALAAEQPRPAGPDR